MLHRGAIVALFPWAASAPLAAQNPWPGATCYTIDLGPWTRTDSLTGASGQPDAPELIILDSARRGAPLGLGDPPDTVNRVAHGRFRPRGSTATYGEYEADRWLSGWSRPKPDSLTVTFGTDASRTSFDFRDAGDHLVGTASWWIDDGGSATARAIARPARCPPGPPRLGRLRLAAVESWAPGLYGEPPMPGVDLELSTEEAVPCGTHIDYTLLVLDWTLAWTVHGLYARAEPCTEAPRPARVLGPGALKPRQYPVLVGVGRDTNRFTLTVTDSSVKLTAERATSVTADERVQARTRHNLFIVRCSFRRARALCDEVDQWLASLPGVRRFGSLPYRQEVNEDVWAERFRYDSPATLARVRACMAWVAEQIRSTADAQVWIRTWLGEEIVASSMRRQEPYDPIPAGVTTRGACAG